MVEEFTQVLKGDKGDLVRDKEARMAVIRLPYGFQTTNCTES